MMGENLVDRGHQTSEMFEKVAGRIDIKIHLSPASCNIHVIYASLTELVETSLPKPLLGS